LLTTALDTVLGGGSPAQTGIAAAPIAVVKIACLNSRLRTI
jgi:hypothetical protein